MYRRGIRRDGAIALGPAGGAVLNRRLADPYFSRHALKSLARLDFAG
jgi:hypothetical protein